MVARLGERDVGASTPRYDAELQLVVHDLAVARPKHRRPRPAHSHSSRMVKKLKLRERWAVIPSLRSLAAYRLLRFLGRSVAPIRIADRRAKGENSWSGHVSWPTSPGPWTRSCCYE